MSTTQFLLQFILINEFAEHSLLYFFFCEQFNFFGGLLAYDFFDAQVDPLGEVCAVDDVHILQSHRVDIREGLDNLFDRSNGQAEEFLIQVQNVVVCFNFPGNEFRVNDFIVDMIDSLVVAFELEFVKVHVANVHYDESSAFFAQTIAVNKPTLQQLFSFRRYSLDLFVVKPLVIVSKFFNARLKLQIAGVVVSEQSLLISEFYVFLLFECFVDLRDPGILLLRVFDVHVNFALSDPLMCCKEMFF